MICFHAHQAAEKYLKALIVAGDEEPPRIQALPKLLSRAISHVPELDTELVHTAANGLNTYYTQPLSYRGWRPIWTYNRQRGNRSPDLGVGNRR